MSDLPPNIEIAVAQALREDIGSGDLTATLVPKRSLSEATIISRETAIVCGTAWCDEVFRQIDASIRIDWQVGDGDPVQRDQVLCSLSGPSRSLLTGERTALNFLQTLSGTATLSKRYADAVSGTGAVVLDTRKTIPGLRRAQKYAVKCGGCRNHRLGLFDALLIKENHILSAGSISAAVTNARRMWPDVTLEVEVETLDELREALQVHPDIIMLDNFTLEAMREAARLTAGRAKLEASGNVNLETLRQIADTGVDYISVGGLTKDVRAIDLSMRFGHTLAE